MVTVATRNLDNLYRPGTEFGQGRGRPSEKVTSVDSLVDQPVALPSITENPTSRRNAAGSDHAPVVATLDIG